MRLSILLVAFFCFIISCQDWEYPHPFPILLTEEVKNINSEGAEFFGIIESLGTSTIIRYGFVWDESEMPTLNSSFLVSGNRVQKGRFSTTVRSDLIDDHIYYVRAFVQTDKSVIYGNQVMFISKGSLPPKIRDHTPTKGFDGTEITISGQNFSSRLEGNIIKIGEWNCEVISATHSLLKIKSPSTSLVGDYKISITTAGKTTVSEMNYSILGPRINSLSKIRGRVGDHLKIEGEYFDISNYMLVFFGAQSQWVTNASYPYVLSDNEAECYVPDYPNTNGHIQLYSVLNSSEKLFKSDYNFTIVDSWAKISEATPLENYREVVRHSSAAIGSSIFVVGGKTLYEFNTITKVWTKKQDFPGSYRYYGTCFSLNGKLYFGFGAGYHPSPSCCENGLYFNDIWEYDPLIDSWTFMGTAPLEARSRMVSFVIEDNVYLGFGWVSYPNVRSFTDLWSYNIVTSTWNQISVPISVNSNSVSSATSFATNGKAFIVGLTYSGDTWDRRADVVEFNPSIQSWTKKSDYPDMINGEVATTIYNHGLVLSSAVNDSRSRVYEYDVEKDRWNKRQSLSGTSGHIQFSHFVNGSLYYSSGNVWALSFD